MSKHDWAELEPGWVHRLPPRPWWKQWPLIVVAFVISFLLTNPYLRWVFEICVGLGVLWILFRVFTS